MKSLLRWVVIVAGAAAMLVSTNQAAAQEVGGLEMSAEAAFGEYITFTAKLTPLVQIQSGTLYIFDSTQAITYTEPVTFDVNGIAEYRFDTRQRSLRPFTTVLWRYEVVLADGRLTHSPTQSIRYDDNRFTWKTHEVNSLRVHWYNGDDAFGIAALNAGLAGLQTIQSLVAADLSQPVDVYIYASEGDLRGTLYESQNWMAGHADSPAGVVMLIIAPGADQNIQMEQRIPHELMHVMFYRQVGAGYEYVPAWLREGVAMQAEIFPNPDYDAYLTDAIERNRLMPIKDLCASFSPQIDSAFLAYAQSRSFVNYLRGQYGMDGLLNLARAYADGVDCERGPERALGISFAKLERDWIISISGNSGFVDMLGSFAPTIGLLCLVILFPLISIVNSLQKKEGVNAAK